MLLERLRLKRRDGGAPAQRGFTLIEVVLTLGLIGLVMTAIYQILYRTLESKRRVELRVLSSRVGPLLLDQIERDLRQLFLFNQDSEHVFSGVDEKISGMDADKLSLVAQTPSTSALVDDTKSVFANVNEIGYTLTANPDNPDFLVLWRREDFFVDQEPLKGGRGTSLYQRITGFDVKYYDVLGKDAKEQDSWNGEKEKGRLPAALLLTLRLEIEARPGVVLTPEEAQRRQYTFKRWLTFPPDLSLSLGVRPKVPLSPSQDGGPGGPGKGGKDGDQDGDGKPDGKGNGGGDQGSGGITIGTGGPAGSAGGALGGGLKK